MKHIEHIEHVEQVEPWTDWTSDPLTLTHHIGESKTMAMAPSPSPSNTSPWEDRRVLWHLWDREIHWWIMDFPRVFVGCFPIKMYMTSFQTYPFDPRLWVLFDRLWRLRIRITVIYPHLAQMVAKGNVKRNGPVHSQSSANEFCAWKTETGTTWARLAAKSAKPQYFSQSSVASLRSSTSFKLPCSKAKTSTHATGNLHFEMQISNSHYRYIHL